ncbi:hypothetical protein TVAG_297670 [Trichomonas vaginalis G3]|uniref:Uncharacterized protein n=1 Tax=Trichomonas vaginalis (strain ATCC PRA-98 / G3) TaxID=412133 RepID=A2DRG2_TRIV3|nr:hypothetical protein TVAGG3_0513610 [Trichomonas vaginalis G3]EAY17088.1 hypothetical protein TVAG_297670 [Trichomonas vaginalis G3]KAI5517960.1 hypothetical protein TVAGG3_0513610 [Trichomonas vaginalis G3]|eukprot:XP_001329311.1 hypothetical protein [Trichomonas vaginalis G3]
MNSNNFFKRVKPKIDQLVYEYNTFNSDIEEKYQEYLYSINHSQISAVQLQNYFVPKGTNELLLQYEKIFRQQISELRNYLSKITFRKSKSEGILNIGLQDDLLDDDLLEKTQNDIQKAQKLLDNQDLREIQDSVVEDLAKINEISRNNTRKKLLLRNLSDSLLHQQNLSPRSLKNKISFENQCDTQLSNDFEKEISELKNEIQERKKKLKDYERETNKIDKESKAIKEKKQLQLNDELETIEKNKLILDETIDLDNKINAILQENKTLSYQLDDLRAENERLRRENFTAQRDKANLENAKKDIIKMKSNCERLQREIEKSEKDLEIYRKIVNDLEIQVKDKENQYTNSESRIKSLEGMMKETDSNLVNTIHKKQKEIDLMNSVSDTKAVIEDQFDNYSDEIVKLFNSDLSRSTSEKVFDQQIKVQTNSNFSHDDLIDSSPIKQKIEIKDINHMHNSSQDNPIDELTSLFS